MEALYLGCLVGGVLFALVTVVLGDLLSTALDGILDFLSLDILKPTVVASAITVFGGAGILLTRYTELNLVPNLIISIVVAIFIAVLVYFFYVKPMENSENSTGYSIHDLVGKIGEITIPLPAIGYGEVMVKIGATNVLHIASSFEQHEIPVGTRVVIVEEADGVLRVTEFDNTRGDEV
ncbi:protease [Paenibacillus crassostreae]|uniref:Protease n=1 Tax=Paenibacillus crassostreae TaxID=1763538 RepID=A0A167CIJ9_9BACL|nr:protease [Paenibacillus crassostreae]AOZ91839.1 protease [Paenibacillus crassostreae]OAB73238.1 protease [Paenibacillus crassostreae]